ncbi:MAG: GntR family transcriptional regulator [Bacteroidota bacterium]
MIQKIIFRDQVKQFLLDKMANGDIKPGQIISLAELSRNLEVSVTPIREALSQLQQIGIVKAVPNRGFQLPSLSLKEAKEIFPIIARLEAWALQESTFSTKSLKDIEKAQVSFVKAQHPYEALIADNYFHELLIKDCPNEILKRMIGDLKARVIMYELEFMHIESQTRQSSRDHEEIIAYIRNHKIPAAAEKLIHNWQLSLDFITQHFEHE